METEITNYTNLHPDFEKRVLSLEEQVKELFLIIETLKKNKTTVMKVYTYYEDINFKHQNRLLDLWKNSWEKHGFEAIVLTRGNAENHPFYIEFVDRLKSIHQHVAGKPLGDYGLSCWLRWLAYATQPEEKFYVCDYDVINHHFNPMEPSSFLHLLDGDCPCIASGMPSQFYDLCNKFVNVPEKNIDAFSHVYKEFKLVHYHDQEFFRIYTAIGKSEIKATRRRETFFGIPGEGEFWKKQLVHYGHNLCHRMCEQKGIKFDEETRCNIVEEYLNKL